MLASSFLLAAYFYFIHRLKRQNYLLAWSIAWLFLFGAHLCHRRAEPRSRRHAVGPRTFEISQSFMAACGADISIALRASMPA